MSQDADPKGHEPDSLPAEPERNLGGRPPHEPTPELRLQIKTLARLVGLEGIAEHVGLSVETINKYYRTEFEEGRSEAIIGVKGKLLTQAMAGNVNAIWKYLHMQGEIKPQRVEHTGRDGGPIQHVDLSRLSAEQLELYGRLAAIAEGLDPDAIIVERIDR